jgi:tetratricopeptide (TPR) repeat protein
VLERHPLSELPPLDRPYLDLTRFYALVDRPDRAREMLEEYEAAVDPRLRHYNEHSRYHRVAGAVALAEGRLEEAIALMRQGDEGAERSWGLAQLGQAYDLAGYADSALAVYERFVTSPDAGRTLLEMQDGPLDGFWLVPICERLASLYEERGDTTKAIRYYAKVTELWKDADPELQPRVQAARRAIEALSPDT